MRFVFSKLGKVFSTRERGASVRAQIDGSLTTVPRDEPLILDFQDVQVASFSFIDEVVGRLVADRGEGERVVLVMNAGEEVVHPLADSMARRSLIVASLGEGGVELIGAPEHIASTFRAAQARGEFKVAELADELRIKPHALNNRLKLMLAAGLLVRRAGIPQAGGREYVYQVAVPTISAAAA